MNAWPEIRKAIGLLKAGSLVGVPTETVYGLAASIEKAEAIEEIFRIKERPYFDPLIVHIGCLEQAHPLVDRFPQELKILADRFWPGPVTFICPKSNKVSDLITAGLPSVGLRLPAHPFARYLAKKAGPYAAPSANKFGRTSPTTADHVKAEFGNKVFVLDGGQSDIGIESSVLEINAGQIRILRPGMISSDELSSFCEENRLPLEIVYSSSSAAPGQTKAHYQPSIPLILVRSEMDAKSVKTKLNLPPESELFDLELSDDPFICARHLYSKLRGVDSKRYDYIVVKLQNKKEKAHWRAIIDRLERASSFQL